MSYNSLQQAFSLLEQNKDLCEDIAPQELSKIDEAQKILAITFPNSYKKFLEIYGHLMFDGQHIYGLYNNAIIANTKDERISNQDPIFPNKLLVIHALGNGELSCLDTSQMDEQGECPVVAWYFGAKLPNGKFEVLAEDFGAFLLEKVKWGLESLDEEKTEQMK
jgi:antitoxin YobK